MSNYSTRPKNNEDKKNNFTVSHIMLFCILLMYVLVVHCCLIFINKTLDKGDTASATQMMYALCSYSMVCGSATIVVYTNKASKENNIKIANDKYRMKLELAKEIYRNISANKLDDKSIALIIMLAGDEKDETLTNQVTGLLQNFTPNINFSSTNTNTSDDALG